MIRLNLIKEDRQRKLIEDVNACRECDLCNRRKGLPVVGQGPLRADIVFVGEAPGLQEESSGYPFVREAPAGKVLTEAVNDAFGYDRVYCFFTNAVLCRPASTGGGKQNDTPDTQHIEACKVNLDEQLSIIDPKVIVGLGKTAARTLTGEERRAGQYRKHLFWYTPWPVIVTWHPSYAARQGGKGSSAYLDMVNDLQIAQSIRCMDGVSSYRSFKEACESTFQIANKGEKIYGT